MSTFSGLNIALSGLYAQRKGLDVTGHNVANANTEGYSRQRVRLSGDGGPTVPAVHSTWSGTGAGVRAGDTQRLRDSFLESRGLTEHGRDTSLRRAQGVLARIEQVFAEPGDMGIGAQLAEFWSGWDDVANHPDDLAARSQLLQRAETLTSSLNQTSAALTTMAEQSRAELENIGIQVNETAATVARLNQAIEVANKGQLSPSDLTDQRDLLVGQLADLVGVTVRPKDNGVVDVYVGGTALVRGPSAESLSVVDSGGTIALRWANNYPATVSGGEAQGLLEALNTTVPKYRQELDGVASRLVATVNPRHQTGQDLGDEAAGLPPAAGQAFFVPHDPADPTATTAANIGLNPALVGQAAKVAAARLVPGDPSDPGGQTGRFDASVALEIAELAHAADGPDSAYRALVVNLGVEADTANRRVDIQAQITRQVDAAREAEAGVNLDEEMTNMVAYQRAYEAAARMLTAVDQIIDTIVNRTGLVGR